MNEDIQWQLEGEPRKAPFTYTGCGLDGICLVSGYEVEETPYGPTVTVKNLDGLHEAISRYLVERKKLLTGKEIRFLRLQMDLTQSQLARLFGCDAQQIARYEKDQNDIPGPADRLLRMLACAHFDGKGKVDIKKVLEELDALDDRQVDCHLFESTPDGWKAAA